MANYTAADVKKLRELTGAGMMDCKKALDEADGDADRAFAILRAKGQKAVAKRETRAVENGAVTARIADDRTSGVLVELKCETDFVAKLDRFVKVADTIAEHVAAESPADMATLLVSDIQAGTTVQSFIDDANAALGEKIVLSRFAQVSGAYVVSYLHRTSQELPPQVGVLVELDKADTTVGKEIAQHIAALAPTVISRDEIPTETISEKRAVAEEDARAEGKPDAALPRIIEGRMTGYFKEHCLLDQSFVRDKKRTVADVLNEASVTVKRFVRYRVTD
jgi:elongation factor Ts